MRLIFIILSVLILANCLSYLPYYEYYLIEPPQRAQSIKTLVIAPMNILSGYPKYLEGKENNILKIISEYLIANGYTVVSNNAFSSAWNQNANGVGGFYNPFNGTLDSAKYIQCLTNTLHAIGKEYAVGGIVFPDIIARDAKLFDQSGLWDGVRRDVILKNAYASSSVFSWSGTMSALSLKITIADTSGKILFKSCGGIELGHQVNYLHNGQGELETREDLLENLDYIRSATRIAFHPFIKADGIPLAHEHSAQSNSHSVIQSQNKEAKPVDVGQQ